MSQDLISYLDKLRLTYIYIPSGYTSTLQPLDVVTNKPFKGRMRASYLAWLEAQVANSSSVRQISPPSEENIMDWVQRAIISLTHAMVTESFYITGLTSNLEDLRDKIKSTHKMAQFLSIFDKDDSEEPAEYLELYLED